MLLFVNNISCSSSVIITEEQREKVNRASKDEKVDCTRMTQQWHHNLEPGKMVNKRYISKSNKLIKEDFNLSFC